MTLHPTKYADLLKKKRQEHKMPVDLINTSWTGGGYGVGKRMELPCPRKCVGAVIDDSDDRRAVGEFKPKAGLVGQSGIRPDCTRKLATSFKENVKQFSLPEKDLSVFGPTVEVCWGQTFGV
ncbi:hypothetical protein PsorP6_015521 [Peronosclerospora sorghi]|uniref:Uncharacterized protein n=1 Tax=Peronosclerospora sorghi TaxID=230839 RepID=A0ACC0WPD2_9STRA|nr:hypothetical protein PsorP6_015521 [Peronosclerospora sorghi]